MTNYARFFLYGFIILIFIAAFVIFNSMVAGIKLEIAFVSVFLTIVLLVSGIVMEYLAVLIFFLLITLFKVAPPSVTFSGFFSQGFWLIFSGAIIGAAIKQSGLGIKFSALLMRFCQGPYVAIVSGMVLFGIFMAFIMPSAMGRVMLMMPILLEFTEKSGFKEGTKARTGVILAGVLGTYIAGFTILPSNLPNIILMGAMGTVYHLTPSYLQYFILHFPVLGLVKLVLLIAVITKLFGQNSTPEMIASQKPVSTDSTLLAKEKRLIFYLAALIFIWVTDYIPPAWAALIVAIICLLPIIGLLNHRTFMKQYHLAPLIYVAGIIGLSAVVNYTGLGNILANKLFAVTSLVPGNTAKNFMTLSLVSTGIGLVTTLPGVPAIMSPLATHIAKMSHLSLTTVLMTQVIGFSTLIFPYQAPPIIVAMRLSNIPVKQATLVCLIMAALTILLLFPTDFLWWKMLGWL
ncbi:MAG: SLC13 family permease [Pseudomonadota bacterium]